MAGPTDILTTIQNGVVALNNLGKQVSGSFNNISSQLAATAPSSGVVTTIAGNSGAFTLNSTSGITNTINDIKLSQGSSSQFGAVKVDGTTITASSGVVSTNIATQADQEAAISTTLAVTPGRQQFHPSASKAWVNFIGRASSGTCTLNANYNVSSVVRGAAVGIYTVTFSQAFSSSNYACFVTEIVGVTNGWGQVQNAGMASSSVQVGFITLGPSAFDPGFGMVLCLGDQP